MKVVLEELSGTIVPVTIKDGKVAHLGVLSKDGARREVEGTSPNGFNLTWFDWV